MNVWEQTARHVCRPPAQVPPWRWAEMDDNFILDKTSSFPGRYRSETAPWAKEPMEKCADNRIRRVVFRCAAQTSKTQTCLILLAFWIATDPGPIMWVMAAQDEAKTFASTRLRPSLEQSKPVREQIPKSRKDNKTLEINFPESPLVINGANSPSKLQSKPIRFLILDEVRNYPKGALQTALKRTTSYWNARELIISTGDTEGDDVDREFNEGDQRHYYVPCLQCGHEFEFEFSQIKWDENEETRPGGEWDFGQVGKTVRHECPACGHKTTDNYAIRSKMANLGKWVARNLKAPSNRVSYTWSALLVPWIPWVRIVEEFLTAKAALDQGAHEPMKTWVTETMGQSWKEDLLWGDDIKTDPSFSMGQKWEKEVFRFMTVDVQRDHYWYVVRCWSAIGESRLVACGRLLTDGDLVEAQKAFGIPGNAVILDCGYDQTRVLQLCTAHGWTAFKGTDQAHFPSFKSGKKINLPYSWPPKDADPGLGTASQGRRWCKLILWSNPTIKDFLTRLKAGKGLYWGVPSDAPIDHAAHMISEMKKKVRNKKTGQNEYIWVVIGRRQNHLWDCECMQLVAAMIQGLVINPFASSKPEETAEAESKA